MRTYEFDLSECYSPEDIHGVIASQLSLPEYYGGNLDALYEALTDPHPAWILRFRGITTVSAVVGEKYMKKFQRMCGQAERESEHLQIIFEP